MKLNTLESVLEKHRGVSKTLATSKMEFFVILVIGFQQLTNCKNNSILKVIRESYMHIENKAQIVFKLIDVARFFICRLMVSLDWRFVQNFALNYHSVVSYPRQCHIGINVNHPEVNIIAIHIMFTVCIFSCTILNDFYNFINHSHKFHM